MSSNLEKDLFIHFIKKDVPLSDEDMKQVYFIEIIEYFSVNPKKRLEKLIHLVENGIHKLYTDDPKTDTYFLVLSELPGINKDIMSFCIDSMLIAEGDTHGEFKSLCDVENKWNQLKNSFV